MFIDSFEQREVHYSSRVIHHFFDTYHLHHALLYAHTAVYSALSPKVWLKHEPANLLHFIDKLKALTEVAYNMIEVNMSIESATIHVEENTIPAVTEIDSYVNRYNKSNAWINFPRNLTATQFNNPYKALAKFCKQMSVQQWSIFLKDLLYYALSKELLTNTYEIHTILKMEKRLLQLIEACHLIEVRCNGNG